MTSRAGSHDEPLITPEELQKYFTCTRCRRSGKKCGYSKPGPCVECAASKQKCDRGEEQRLECARRVLVKTEAVDELMVTLQFARARFAQKVRRLGPLLKQRKMEMKKWRQELLEEMDELRAKVEALEQENGALRKRVDAAEKKNRTAESSTRRGGGRAGAE
ncbi:hypothetical protein CYLTODRAFT_494859 [Cylindrobasidium torrendii FP15055 ss-10]|uniref:Zn(2)-C6 fungal-type domain-containing protein n=1 Tax=Cylindrobasidium torrendii FP15055 ss-10 TaxID=1314674 RepID=A0A0D7AVT7_9AGAR|nr:hypothetical protein CYLTODRAFT_494859 [Cylindrobasidium torrendii FP15055 ss-10]